jgi:hypothetical protein
MYEWFRKIHAECGMEESLDIISFCEEQLTFNVTWLALKKELGDGPL